MTRPPHVLITAGSTREPIDEVRWWTNIFTGRTGLDIALRMLDIADVTLLTANAEHARYCHEVRGASGVLTTGFFQTHSDLSRMIPTHLARRKTQAVFMTAAVSDYKPTGAYQIMESRRIEGTHPSQYQWIVQDVQARKIPGAHERLAIAAERTLKLIDQFRTAWDYRGLLFKFKLEVGISEKDLLAIAEASRRQSGADAIVANTLEMVRGDSPAAWLIDARGAKRVARGDLPAALRDYTAAHLKRESGLC